MSILRKYWTNKRPKPAGHTQNLASPWLMSMYSCDPQFLSTLFTVTHFFLLNWFHSLLTANLGRSHITLPFLSSWGLQGNMHLAFTASHNGFSGSQLRDIHNTCLASEAILSSGGRFHNFFLLSLTLKSEPHNMISQDLSPRFDLGLEQDPLLKLHLQRLSVFNAFLYCLSWLS